MKEEIGKKYYQFPQEMVTSIPWVVHNLTLIALLMKPSTLSGSRQARLSVVTLRLKFHVPKASPGNISNINGHRVGCAKKHPHATWSHTFVVILQNNLLQTRSDSKLHHYGLDLMCYSRKALKQILMADLH